MSSETSPVIRETHGTVNGRPRPRQTARFSVSESVSVRPCLCAFCRELTVANGRKRSQTVANDRQWSPTGRAVVHGLGCAFLCLSLSVCRERSRTVANGRERSRTVADGRRLSQTVANGRKRCATAVTCHSGFFARPLSASSLTPLAILLSMTSASGPLACDPSCAGALPVGISVCPLDAAYQPELLWRGALRCSCLAFINQFCEVSDGAWKCARRPSLPLR